uniref:Uncharacterized protein n=1 Tax=Tanacetum cinerariifolium TaxID=118510 RepID=A0A699HVD8_TANCI|nr:hypothetical protein [Tanacetum cinerariifolium]
MGVEILQARENLMQSIQTFLRKFNQDIHELLCKLLEDLQIINEELTEYINSPSWNSPTFYDDDDEYTIQYKEYLENLSNAITPDLPTEEPDNSLSMGDEHLSTISKTESDEVIKSSVENFVPIPSKSKVIFDDICDVPFCDNSPPLDILTGHFDLFFDFNDNCTSSDDDYFEDINYVEASPPDSELVSLEESTSLFPIPIDNSDSFIEKSDTSLSYSDNSLPEFETFSDHTEETSSGSTTTHADNSLLESGDTLEYSKSKKLKSSHSTTQLAELQETTSVSACSTIAIGDPTPAVTSASSILAATPIAAGVSTTSGAFGSASEASVLIIKLLDSPPKDTSLSLDSETEEQDAPLRKSSKKKSIARKRTLPSPSKPKSDALPFDEDDPEAEFKRYLRQASDDDEPAKLVSLALVSDITTWEIIPTEFGFNRADLMVLYGLVLDKYKTKRATETEAGDIMYMFVYKKYPLSPETIQRMLNHGLEIDRDQSGNDLTTDIQLIQSLLNQLNPAA